MVSKYIYTVDAMFKIYAVLALFLFLNQCGKSTKVISNCLLKLEYKSINKGEEYSQYTYRSEINDACVEMLETHVGDLEFNMFIKVHTSKGYLVSFDAGADRKLDFGNKDEFSFNNGDLSISEQHSASEKKERYKLLILPWVDVRDYCEVVVALPAGTMESKYPSKVHIELKPISN